MYCKICGASQLTAVAHTVKCWHCGTLLFYPYPEVSVDHKDEIIVKWKYEQAEKWYLKSSFYNHKNFTNMVLFSLDKSEKSKIIDILDYGGGGGQFALVVKSLFPKCNVYITDINDEALLNEFKKLNHQILYKEFKNDNKKFDYIFLNDVFEHVANPGGVLKLLKNKLKDSGKIFIDTPKQFWLYPVIRVISSKLYIKLLKGTVTKSHLQIWSRKSFDYIVTSAGFSIKKYKEISEYTMPPDYYLQNMGIRNFMLRFLGRVFYRNAKWLARNKIICLLEKNN